jgi:hypothetical protein
MIKKNHIVLFILFLFSSLSLLSLNSAQGIERIYYNDIGWLDNPSFDSPIGGTWINSTSGDISDLNTSFSPGQANFEVLGKSNTYSIAEDPPRMINNWSMVENPEFPILPTNPRNTSKGFEVYHNFAENAVQMTSVHWTKEIDMGINMADYVITDASINVTVNGTVRGNSGTYDGYYGVEAVGDYTDSESNPPGPPTLHPQFTTYDYVRYYALVSDPSYNNVFEIAYNQTTALGKDNSSVPYSSLTYDYMTNTTLVQIPKESLIFFLTSVLAEDHQRFNLTLGMRIWCEDNFLHDGDRWESLVINSYNFSFTYEKKINQFSTVSWTQIGNQIPTENITITNGIINYKYKINETWTDKSPNSELLILVNGDALNETIKLSTATTQFQNASDGFNVTSLLRQGVNISVSIQLLISDEFSLSEGFKISIDDVQLWVSYVEEIYVPPNPPPSPPPYGLFSALAVLGTMMVGGFALYETVFKYPTEVRHIRKLRRKVRRGSKIKPIHTKNSNTLSKSIYNSDQTELQKKMKASHTKTKIPPSKSQPTAKKPAIKSKNIAESGSKQPTEIKKIQKTEGGQ